jgi:hypothetical protein
MADPLLDSSFYTYVIIALLGFILGLLLRPPLPYHPPYQHWPLYPTEPQPSGCLPFVLLVGLFLLLVSGFFR